jgi:uncharacterized ParB-like nuclease family protein
MKLFSEIRSLSRAIKLGDRLAKKSAEAWEKEPPSYMKHKATSTSSHKLVKGTNVSDEDYAGMERYKHHVRKGHDVFDPDKVKPNIQDVPIHHLTPTQSYTEWNHDAAPKHMKNREHILVVRHKGKHYIIDGHHRVVAARLRGEKTINANVQDLD